MPFPRVLVLRAPGTNCDQETTFAFELAGARTEAVHVGRLLENAAWLDDFQIVALPGGFSYGDDLGAGRILGTQLRLRLADALRALHHRGGLILGICNGFQVLMNTGLLAPDDPQAGPAATLAMNASGKYEDRWVHLVAQPGACVFLRGIERMYLPVAHAEGRLVTRDAATFAALAAGGQLALRYAAGPDSPADAPLEPACRVPYPANPNGAQGDVAGLCDPTGRVLGLMPHPERHIDRTHHPRWTRGEGSDPGDGLQLFRNAVEHFQ